VSKKIRKSSLILLLVAIFPVLTGCPPLFVSEDGRLELYRIYYAKEVVSEIYVVPLANSVDPTVPHLFFSQTVYRGSNQNFMLRATLSDGAKFSATGAEPVLAYAANAGGGSNVTPLIRATDERDHVEWLVSVTAGFTGGGGPPEWTISFTGVAIDAGQVLQDGGAVELTVSTRDSGTGVPFDTDVTGRFLVGVQGVAYDPGSALGIPMPTSLVRTSAVIDLDAEGNVFVPNNPDTITEDKGGTVGRVIDGYWGEELEDATIPGFDVYDPSGNPYSLSAGDHVDFIFRSDLSGIAKIDIAPDPLGPGVLTDFELPLDDEDRASNEVTVSVPGDVVHDWAWLPAPPFQIPIPNPLEITFEVLGDQQLRTRILTLEIRVRLETGTEYQLLEPTEITRWVVNGTILIAPWVNGNDTSLQTDIYLMNNSGRNGTVKVRVLPLPRVGNPAPQLDLGTVQVGVLPPNGAASFNLAQQVLQPLGLRPYTTDGGNLTLEITVIGVKASGVSQVKSGGMCFGTMQLIASEGGLVQ